MNTRFKVLAFYNLVQYVFNFIFVLTFVKVSKYPKNLKLTNIVLMKALIARCTELFPVMIESSEDGETSLSYSDLTPQDVVEI